MTEEQIKREFDNLLPWEKEDMLYELAKLTYGKPTADKYSELIFNAEYDWDNDRIDEVLSEVGENDILDRIDKRIIIDFATSHDMESDIIDECDTEWLVNYLKHYHPEVVEAIQEDFDPMADVIKEDEANRIHDLAYAAGYNDGRNERYSENCL